MNTSKSRRDERLKRTERIRSLTRLWKCKEQEDAIDKLTKKVKYYEEWIRNNNKNSEKLIYYTRWDWWERRTCVAFQYLLAIFNYKDALIIYIS